MTRWIVLLALFIFWPSEATAQRRKLTTDIKEIVLENRYLSRKFAFDLGWLRTSHFVNLQTGENLVVGSPEFQIKFENGLLLTSQDFVAEYYTPTVLQNGVSKSLFSLTEKKQRVRLEMEYTLGLEDFFMRKRLRLYPLQSNLPRVLSVSVEALRVANPGSVGFSLAIGEDKASSDSPLASWGQAVGQPLFLKESFFWGLEYPAGRNSYADGLLKCIQDPGRQIPEHGFETHSAVSGISPRGDVEEWFQRYMSAFRLPSRRFVIYRLRSDKERNALSERTVREKLGWLQENLLRPFAVRLDAIVLEHRWEQEDSLLKPNSAHFPEGLGGLGEMLKANGTGLGFHVSLDRYPLEQNVVIQKGFEQLPKAASEQIGFCVAGARYRAALKRQLTELHQETSMSFVRHDWIGSTCRSSQHGHPAEEYPAFQAATDAVIEILRLERSLNAELMLSLSGNFWPSPWWLQYANAMELSLGKEGYLRSDLSPRQEDWETSHEAAALREEVSTGRFQVPLARRLTIGLNGKLTPERRNQEDFDSVWADVIVEYLGRGHDVIDLSGISEALGPKNWETLGRGLQWKANRQSVFQRSELVGGDPGKSEPHGYMHWGKSQAVVILRNPSPSPAEVSFQLPKGLGTSLRILQTYPRLRLESAVLKSNDIVNTPLDGLETRVLELAPDRLQDFPLPLNVDFVLTELNLEGAASRIKLEVFPENPEILFSQPQAMIELQIGGKPTALDASGKAGLQSEMELMRVVEGRRSMNERKAEVGVYARRGVQLSVPQWEEVTSSLTALLSQPKEKQSASPLYVTLNRKQLTWATQQTFHDDQKSRIWNVFVAPLNFSPPGLLDWAVKDDANTSLNLWWVIEAPRPGLEMTYAVPEGKNREHLATLLSSPKASRYRVNIPLEGHKQ